MGFKAGAYNTIVWLTNHIDYITTRVYFCITADVHVWLFQRLRET